MAIALDRLHRGDGEPHRPGAPAPDARRSRARGCATRRRLRRGVGSRCCSATLLGAPAHDWSRWTAQDWLRATCRTRSTTSRTPTRSSSDITTRRELPRPARLEPLRSFFIETPWPVMLAGLVAIALSCSAACGPRVDAFAMLLASAWSASGRTRWTRSSQVLVATVLTVVDRLRLRRLGGREPARRAALRPVNDVLQTLPQLVYIIPFIYLMPVSGVPGVVASVLYASPVMIRLVRAASRDVPAEAVEAATSFGATRLQVLVKVKIPLARDAIMLGVNQGIIMVLAVVVIGGLVGSGALGYEVVQRAAAQRVRAGRRRVARDPRARHRARPRHQGTRRGRQEAGPNVIAITKEDRMQDRALGRAAGSRSSRRARRSQRPRSLVGGRQPRAPRASCGTVTLNEQAWAGSTANTYVAKAVLEKYLGCKVKITQDRRDPCLPGARRRQDRRRARGLAARRPVQAVHRPSRRRSSSAARTASSATSAGSSRRT